MTDFMSNVNTKSVSATPAYLFCHIALKLAKLPEYSLSVVKSSSLIKKLGKFNGAETKVINGRLF